MDFLKCLVTKFALNINTKFTNHGFKEWRRPDVGGFVIPWVQHAVWSIQTIPPLIAMLIKTNHHLSCLLQTTLSFLSPITKHSHRKFRSGVTTQSTVLNKVIFQVTNSLHLSHKLKTNVLLYFNSEMDFFLK